MGATSQAEPVSGPDNGTAAEEEGGASNKETLVEKLKELKLANDEGLVSDREKKLVHVPGGISPDQRLYVSMRTIPLADFLASIDKEGMDLDKESDVSGGTLLTWAAEFHRSDICRVLLERNADPLKKSRVEKMNALEWATRTPAKGSDGAQERDQVISMLTKSAQ